MFGGPNPSIKGGKPTASGEQGTNKVAVAKQCSMHGVCDIRQHAIDLTSTKEKFISYICLLAQLYFKILKIEDG